MKKVSKVKTRRSKIENLANTEVTIILALNTSRYSGSHGAKWDMVPLSCCQLLCRPVTKSKGFCSPCPHRSPGMAKVGQVTVVVRVAICPSLP